MGSVAELVAAVRAGDRGALGRAITLVESAHPDHSAEARELIAQLMAYSGKATRVGITGLPGAGKSTFIDALGTQLTNSGQRVAVLAVDPSSTVHGGSILADKTRMARLANDPAAFVRPSPSSGALGGVTRHTRETMVVLEAAGYDVVLVETVGVGQSETAVADMVDTFVVLSIPGAGDELQGIKKGVLELADIVVVNKADGERIEAAEAAARDLTTALHLVTPPGSPWQPPVLLASALHEEGLDLVWGQIGRHRDLLLATGELETRRSRQLVLWMWAMADEHVLEHFHADAAVRRVGAAMAKAVLDGELTASEAAARIIEAFDG